MKNQPGSGTITRNSVALLSFDRPRSADRTRSPAAVSQKRDFFWCPPETIGDFGLRMPKIGAWRLVANSQKPAIGGLFCERQGDFHWKPDWLAGDAVLI